MNKIEILARQLNPKNTKLNEILAGHTTLKIGGPADIFYETHDIADFIKVAKLARLQKVPVTVLGRGSNVLISDKGIRGLVIKNLTKVIKIAGEKPIHEDKVQVTPRWESDKTKGTFKYEFKDIDYDESSNTKIEVIMDSGVDLPFAINYLLAEKITGLQWYAGIPGTIGGAVLNNIHGGTHFINEILTSVKVLDTKTLEIVDIPVEKLKLDYNKSRFHTSDEIILQATFNLYKGNAEKGRRTAAEWAKRKKIQPRNSAGCVFANITQKQKKKFKFPTTGVGYIIEHLLHLSNFRIGDAAISEKHNNFIVNKGNATAEDYLAVMKKVCLAATEKLNIQLIPEIRLLGFEDKEIKDLNLTD